MTAPRRGFDVPYGAISDESGQPTQGMSEWMDKNNDALTKLKAAATAMSTLDPSSATASDCANTLEAMRVILQGIE